LGLSLERLNRLADATLSLKKAIDLAPRDPNYRVSLGQVYRREGNSPLAIHEFRAALSLRESPVGFVELADLYLKADKPLEAENCLKAALRLDPNMGLAHEMLGIVHEELGQFDEAIVEFCKGFDLQAGKTSILYRIARSKRLTLQDRPFIGRLERLIKSPDLNDDQRRYVLYALGKACDDLAEYESAIRYFDEANCLSERIQFKGKKYQQAEVRATFESIKSRFTTEFFQQHRRYSSSNSERPVFVVGMLRSGTTLVEQILSTHPEIAGAGELPFFLDASAKSVLQSLIANRADHLALTKLASEYLVQLGAKAGGESRVIDKMPNNYMALGLVHLLFPEARIVHCRRNAVDNCLSIYTTVYSDPPKFAYRRENIVAAYRAYENLMEHWHSVIPANRLLTVDYENLVADQESVTRRIVEFVGLDWDDACLRHESNPRRVNTPSLWQVRQPMYSTSVERWRNYEPWLGQFEVLR